MDVSLPDGVVIKDVPQGTTKDQLLVKLQRANHPSAQALMTHMAGEQATNDTSGVGKFLAGAGKSVSDLGLGIRQLTGNASQAEVDETKNRDSALMDSGAGMTGNIAGNVGMAVVPGLGAVGAGKTLGMPALQAAGRFALSSPASMGGAVTQGTLGAVQSGLQPVSSGESRAGNAALGFAGGAAIPAAGMTARGAHAVIEPMYQSGRENIMGRTLRRVADGDVNQTISNLRNARELVPGSLPTAGQAGGNAGVAALERAAFAVEPSVTVPVANRLTEQNAARVAALRDMAGTAGGRDAAVASRESTAGPLYRQAFDAGVDPQVAASNRPLMENLQARMPAGVVDRAKEIARVEGRTLTDANSLEGLHYVKKAVDDLLDRANTNSGVGSQMHRALSTFKNDLLSTMDTLSPQYGQAREAFRNASRPVNQMDVAGEIANRSIRPLDEHLTPTAYARALSDETAQRATGFNRATLANTMEPHQLSTLNAIRDDLARSRFAETAGRGVGSDTVQKMAYTNLMQQSGLSGLPNLLSRPVQMAEYFSRAAYGSADREMRRQLAEALLDPRRTAQLMGAGIPSQTAQRLAQALRSGAAPLATGGVPAMLDAR